MARNNRYRQVQIKLDNIFRESNPPDILANRARSMGLELGVKNSETLTILLWDKNGDVVIECKSWEAIEMFLNGIDYRSVIEGAVQRGFFNKKLPIEEIKED